MCLTSPSYNPEYLATTGMVLAILSIMYQNAQSHTSTVVCSWPQAILLMTALWYAALSTSLCLSHWNTESEFQFATLKISLVFVVMPTEDAGEAEAPRVSEPNNWRVNSSIFKGKFQPPCNWTGGNYFVWFKKEMIFLPATHQQFTPGTHAGYLQDIISYL